MNCDIIKLVAVYKFKLHKNYSKIGVFIWEQIKMVPGVVLCQRI